ncbi:hypothetical protein ROZALSC1DRAFT_23211 [Rozella allomycis CSF55]|uniref:X-box-binding protein 1 n=1 Tax=Rozella allomycis (strain CSF55) TaxID=988480 RepID=A0A4P9YGP7_ROZAC|nr:hypothetical protein ROZALSC1DRAFT_23211 [Rozella allomycis CSF55]
MNRTNPLSKLPLEKINERKMKNRLSALESRQRKKRKMEEMEFENISLKDENEFLRNKIRILEESHAKLQETVQELSNRMSVTEKPCLNPDPSPDVSPWTNTAKDVFLGKDQIQNEAVWTVSRKPLKDLPCRTYRFPGRLLAVCSLKYSEHPEQLFTRLIHALWTPQRIILLMLALIKFFRIYFRKFFNK